jgi:hypothetical protein
MGTICRYAATICMLAVIAWTVAILKREKEEQVDDLGLLSQASEIA